MLKFANYRNYCNNSIHILYSDKHHQMSFAGSLNMRITNPTWRTAAILEKSKNRQISATVWPIATKFGKITQIDSPEPPNLKKFQILECGQMPNVMVALPNTGGALCLTPQTLADAHYWSAVQ